MLVNGVSGIATGWNCSIPCYNPKDIIANIKRFLNDDKLQPMVPWYKGFKGTIDKSIEGGYVVSGKVEVIDDQSFRITELPVGTWTKKYLKFLKDHPLIEVTDLNISLPYIYIYKFTWFMLSWVIFHSNNFLHAGFLAEWR